MTWILLRQKHYGGQGWWLRALWNGIPENDCEAYMAAHFAAIDAQISGNQEEARKAAKDGG